MGESTALFVREPGGHRPDFDGLRLERQDLSSSALTPPKALLGGSLGTRSCGRGVAGRKRAASRFEKHAAAARAAGADALTPQRSTDELARSAARPRSAVPARRADLASPAASATPLGASIAARTATAGSRAASPLSLSLSFAVAPAASAAQQPADEDGVVIDLRSGTAPGATPAPEYSIAGVGEADLLSLKAPQRERAAAADSLRIGMPVGRTASAAGLVAEQLRRAGCGVAALADPGPRLVDTEMDAVAAGAAGFDGAPFTPLDPAAFGGEDAARRLLFQWYRAARDEERAFASKSLWAGAVHRQLQRATQSLPAPNLLRTASACVLLSKVLAELSDSQCRTLRQGALRPALPGYMASDTAERRRPYGLQSLPAGAHPAGDDDAARAGRLSDAGSSVHSSSPGHAASLLPSTVAPALDDEFEPHEKGTLMPVLRNLLNDVFAAVFEGWGTAVLRPFEKLLRDGDVEAVFTPLRLFASKTAEVRKELADYRNGVDQFNKGLEQERQRKIAVMHMELEGWKLQITKRLFRLWRKETQESLKARKALENVIRRMAERAEHFVKWVAFLRMREHGVFSKSKKDQADHDREKRDWREKKAELQLEVGKLKAELSTQRREHQERMEEMQRLHQEVQDKCRASEKRMREQMEAAELRATELQEELQDTQERRDQWALLCNKMMFELSGRSKDEREHPFWALLTDRPKRRFERVDLKAQIKFLTEACDLHQRVAQAQDHDESKQNLQGEEAEIYAKERARSDRDEQKRQKKLEALNEQLEEIGLDDNAFDLISSHASIPDMLNANHAVERVLLRFCNYILETAGIFRQTPIENFSTDMQDSEVFVVVLAALWPTECDLQGLQNPNKHARAVGVIESLSRVDLDGMLAIDDILMGRANRNMVFIGTLFRLYCVSSAIGMTGKSGEKALVVDDIGDIDDDVWETRGEMEARLKKMAEMAEAGISPASDPLYQSEDDELDGVDVSRTRSRGCDSDRSKGSGDDVQGLITSPPMSPLGASRLSPGERSLMSPTERSVMSPSRREPSKKFKRRKHRKPKALPVNYNIEEMASRYRELSKSNKGWLFLGETTARGLIKRLQSGRTRDGEILDSKARRQMATFTQLDEVHSADLMEGDHNQGDELDLCEDVLIAAYEDLRAMYQYYTTADGGFKMSQTAFWNMLKDCRMNKGATAKRNIETSYQKAAKDLEAPAGSPLPQFMPTLGTTSGKGKDKKEDGASVDTSVSPQIFVETLTRLAVIERGRASGLGTSKSLQRFLEDNIMPNGAKSSIDEFRRSMQHPDLQKVIKRNLKFLQKTFKMYVTTGLDENGEKVLQLEEWLKFIKECKLIDAKLSFSEATSIFVNIMYDETKCSGDHITAGLTYDEFTQALVCVSAFKHSAPYMPIARRTDDFFRMTLLGKLKERFRQGAQ